MRIKLEYYGLYVQDSSWNVWQKKYLIKKSVIVKQVRSIATYLFNLKNSYIWTSNRVNLGKNTHRWSRLFFQVSHKNSTSFFNYYGFIFELLLFVSFCKPWFIFVSTRCGPSCVHTHMYKEIKATVYIYKHTAVPDGLRPKCSWCRSHPHHV